MRFAIVRALILALANDRGALILGFALPAAVFVVFAYIFASTAGGTLSISIALADLRQDAASEVFARILLDEGALVDTGTGVLDPAGVEALVRDGTADVGLVIPDNNVAFPGASDGSPAVVIVTEPSRQIASVAVRAAAQAALSAMSGVNVADSVAERSIVPMSDTPVSVSYYAVAVGMLFLLLSATASAGDLVRERESGLFDRLGIGIGGRRVVVDGWFLFMTIQGVAQIVMVFAVAWLGFGVDVLGVFHLWLVLAICSASAAAGFGMLIAVICRTSAQVQALGTSAALIVSAIGGSMVPRFLMPGFVQDVGWMTPNTWALEGMGAILWRGEGGTGIVLSSILLLTLGICGLLAGRRLA